MKNILLTIFLFIGSIVANAQIVITGIMSDPSGTDASTTVGVKAYEYAQFRATQNIDFAVTPYSVVFLYEITSTPLPDNGWNSGSQGLTYQMNLNSGTVAKGDFFYVGGDGMKIWGSSSTDISSAKWIKSIDYAKILGDNSNGNTKTGLLGNSTRANGIAVFSTTNVTATSVPIDVIFFGSVGSNHYNVGPPEKGFRITDNDLYKTVDGEYFAKSINTNTIALSGGADDLKRFIQLGGNYDLQNNVWVTPRSANLVTLTNSSTLADIETGSGVTTLPVSLNNFAARFTKQGEVSLKWNTTSEINNSHFEVTRSGDGVNFYKIGNVLGNNNSNSEKHYSYTDNNPLLGVNYYQLKQVDYDGKSSMSKILSVHVSLNQNDLLVAKAENKSSITVYFNSTHSGKTTFTIYSVNGLKIKSVQRNVNIGENQINIPIDMDNSVKILKVQQNGQIKTLKF